MKKRAILSLLLGVILALSLAACGEKQGNESSTDEGSAKLTGTYLLDSTALGMPLQVYLIIENEETFQWTNRRENGDDKGHGTIGKNAGTYLLMYSDSTNEAPKTATFTVKGGNLLFSTRVPYGTSSFAPNTEDESNIIYPEALKLIHEEYLGEFVGASESYDYTLTFSYGAQYHVKSTDGTADYTESGLFSVKDGAVTLIPTSGEAAGVAFAGDKVTLSGAVINAEGKKADMELSKATTSQYAGRYLAAGDVTLTLNKLGAYSYNAGSYTETGTFTAQDEAVSFTAADGSKRTGTVQNYMAKASFPKTSGGTLQELTAYEHLIQGKLSAESEQKEDGDIPKGKYAAEITLSPDGKYVVSISRDGNELRSEKGSFATVPSAAGVTLALTSENHDKSSGVIAAQTINFRLVVDEELNEVGFQFTKK